jgi:hypothetical protein
MKNVKTTKIKEYWRIINAKKVKYLKKSHTDIKVNKKSFISLRRNTISMIIQEANSGYKKDFILFFVSNVILSLEMKSSYLLDESSMIKK